MAERVGIVPSAVFHQSYKQKRSDYLLLMLFRFVVFGEKGIELAALSSDGFVDVLLVDVHA